MAIHFIDTETTGLDASRHEIIEIAVITEYGDGKKERWCRKVKPSRTMLPSTRSSTARSAKELTPHFQTFRGQRSTP